MNLGLQSRITIVMGTRPEGIKLAPVILEGRRRGANVRVVSTGQHREMLKPIFELFGTRPDCDLELMRPGQTLAEITSRALKLLSREFAEFPPEVVLVQGDTTTAMAAALAAFYLRIPVGHVEAGLRTNDRGAPFPEEVNRRIIGQVAQWHFAPTAASAAALERENIPALGGRIVVTGNTGIDALLEAVSAEGTTPSSSAIHQEVSDWKRDGGRMLLVTGHRRENFGEPFREFCLGLRDLAEAFPDLILIYPVHLNPNVQAPVKELLSGHENVRLLPVADYPDFVRLMKCADLIITDSGGVQEEAPALGVPVLVTRHVTERPEAVDAGGVLLVGPSRAKIVAEASRLLGSQEDHAQMARRRFPYGDGRAAERIWDVLLSGSCAEFRAGANGASASRRDACDATA